MFVIATPWLLAFIGAVAFECPPIFKLMPDPCHFVTSRFSNGFKFYLEFPPLLRTYIGVEIIGVLVENLLYYQDVLGVWNSMLEVFEHGIQIRNSHVADVGVAPATFE